MCKLLLTFLLIIHCVVTNAYNEQNLKTLHGYKDPPDERQKTFIFNAEQNEPSAGYRQKRDTANLTKKQPLFDNGIITKVSRFVGLFLLVDLLKNKINY